MLQVSPATSACRHQSDTATCQCLDPMAAAVGKPPPGWSVQTELKKVGGVEQNLTHFVTRTGKKVSTMNEVHYHLKVCGGVHAHARR